MWWFVNVQRSASLTETPESGSSGSQTDVVNTRDNWLTSFSSSTATPGTDGDTKSPPHARLFPSPKLPLTSTKSAPESLSEEPVTAVPASEPEEVSLVSTGSAASSSIVFAASGLQKPKPVAKLPTALLTKCK